MSLFNDEKPAMGQRVSVQNSQMPNPQGSQGAVPVAAAKDAPAAKDQAFWTDVAAGRAKHPGKCPTCGRDR